MKKTTILLVGDYSWPWYQEACAQALESLGCNVVRFSWFDDFRHWLPDHSKQVFHSVFHHIQYRLKTGPTVRRVSRRLFNMAVDTKPDIVWFYNVQLISKKVLVELREQLPKATFCQYANDNPFSKDAKWGLWRNYLASIGYFDLYFSYRHNNVDDYIARGAMDVYLLRSYFIPEADYPVAENEIPEKFKCDVVFAGHYEDDGRVEMLEVICKAGYKLNLFGGGWDEALKKLSVDSPLRKKYPIQPATGADYRYAICGAKVALSFLSTLNKDTYTRRSFQIPAMKTVMLSQHSDDLESLFKPDFEAMFFKNINELLNKLERLNCDNDLRLSIAKAGYRRVFADGHDVKNRMKTWLKTVSNKT